MKEPNIIINWMSVGGAMLAGFVLGGLWYGPLFGKKWASLMGINWDQKPDPKVMKRAFLLQIIGLFLTTYVLVHSNQIWRPSVWGVGEDQANYIYGFFGAFFTWIGFYIPLQLGKVAWENKPWKLFLINSGHDFVNLMLISQILAHWR